MAKASPVIPGASWEITRRCHDRRFLLRPDPAARQAILYCVAYCSNKYEMLLHALEIMSNHMHQKVTDPKANRNDYVWELHSMIAKCIKKLRGKDGKEMQGPVWDASESYGRLWMASEEAFVESIVYILANPVVAGIVDDPNEWSGSISRAEDMLERRQFVIARPDCLGDSYPATATLRFCLPPAFEGRGYHFVAQIKTRLAEVLGEEKRQRREEGRKVLGAEVALEVNPFDSPKTQKKANLIKPQFRAVTRKAIVHARKTMVAWHRAYRLSFEAFRRGKRKIEWPAGTWWFARYAGVVVAPVSTWFALGSS